MTHDIPYVASLVEARNQIGALLDEMIDDGAGPLILGHRGAPSAVLVEFALFDQMRDQLGWCEARDLVPLADARAAHPAGASSSTLGVLVGTDDQTDVTWWPELVGDLRVEVPVDLADVLAAVATGRLDGTGVGGGWRWFVVVSTPQGAPARGWHVLWRVEGDVRELVAAVPVSELLARAWRAGPEMDRV